MDELDYSSFSNEERTERLLKEAGQLRANVWANTCHSLKMFFFGMSMVYILVTCNTIKDNGFSWQLFTQHVNLMNLLMVISSISLWRTALDAESRLLFQPRKAPAYLLHLIPMAACYCFLTVAIFLYYCVSTQIIDIAIFTVFWCSVSLIVDFVLFNALSLKVSRWVRYEIYTSPEMRTIFPDGEKFPADESSFSGYILWVAHIAFMAYFVCACYTLY